MKSLTQYIQKVRENRPGASDIIILAEAVKNRNFSLRRITEEFNRTVSKEDYESKVKKLLIDWMYSISNPPEEREKQG